MFYTSTLHYLSGVYFVSVIYLLVRRKVFLRVFYLYIYSFTNFLFSLFILLVCYSSIYNFYYFSADYIVLGLCTEPAAFIFLLLAFHIAALVIVLVGTKVSQTQRYMYLNIVILMGVFVLFFFEKNIFLVFFYYELLLIPSYLLIFYLSPNKRFLIVSIYFLVWTQVGSFCVFLSLSYIYVYYGILFNSVHINLSSLENNLIIILIYVGFGIKIPVWPFFYWLTKTHVEAPSFFSIYLSGFLVKTALLGFYKFIKFFFITHTLNYLLIFSIFGIIDSSLKLWIQVDLKKLVAFCTVQEMNLIFFLVCFNTTNVFVLIALFSLTHALLSALFFYLVDIVYRIYGTRSVSSLTGLLVLSPNLAVIIYVSIILYNGLPFTLKFLVELNTFQLLYDYNFFIYLNVVIACNWIGCIGLAKHWFGLIFSTPQLGVKGGDVTKKELTLLLYILFLLVFGVQLTLYIF